MSNIPHDSRNQPSAASLLVLALSTSILGCDARSDAPTALISNETTATTQAAPATTSITVEPTTLDMGDLIPDIAVVKRVKLTNHSSKPVKITSAIADCSCTTPTWPEEPIAPGATVEADITVKAGPKQGVPLNKRVTYSIEGGELVFLSVVAKVGLFIELTPETMRAPADDLAAPEPGEITLKGADATAFRIIGSDPAIATADNNASALTHTVRVDWTKWRDAKRPSKLSIITDHPKTPEMQVLIRRSPPSVTPTVTPPVTPPVIAPTQIGSARLPVASQTPPFTANQPVKPRQYKIVLPTVYPGATVAFPPLGTFVQGSERRAFAPGKIYVFEFFSTTCGHCAEAAPLVEALVEQFSSGINEKAFEFISVTADDESKVREWLLEPAHAEQVKHSVAIDVGSKAQKALQDPTYQVLNPRFFVIRDGVVLWYGHPDAAAEPFAQIAAGTWNPDSVKAEFLDNALVARAKNQTTSLLNQCEKDGKWKDLLDLYDSIAVAIPSRGSTFELQKFGTMIGPADMTVEGYAYGMQLAVHYANDIASLRTLARTTLNSPRVKVRDLDFAFAIARAADSLGGEKDARAAEILALAYFSRGDRENAIKLQERAITLQDNAKIKATYETQLAKYRVNEPKPVPFTPKVTPGAAPANAVPTGNPVGLPAELPTGSPADGG